MTQPFDLYFERTSLFLFPGYKQSKRWKHIDMTQSPFRAIHPIRRRRSPFPQPLAIDTATGGRWKWRTLKWRTIEMSRHEIDGHENAGHVYVSGVWIGLHGIDFDLSVLPSNRLLLRFQECSRSKSKLKTIRLHSDDHCVFQRCPSQKKDARRVCRWVDIRRPLIAIISHKRLMRLPSKWIYGVIR